MNMPKRLLVPVDFSDCSKAAVNLAKQLGAEITLLHVWQPPELAGADLYVLAHSEKLSIGELGQRQAKQELDQLADALGLGAAARRVEIGKPRERIVELAESGDYDWIVMGTHGRTGRARLFAGSVTEGVVRRSAIPVLTVRG